MTNSKHTPGPWWFSDNGDNSFDIGAADYVHARASLSHSIPGAKGFYDAGHTKAHARLIAASPDLLAALIRCEQVLYNYRMNHDAENNPFNKAQEQAFEAIARATGKGE